MKEKGQGDLTAAPRGLASGGRLCRAHSEGDKPRRAAGAAADDLWAGDQHKGRRGAGTPAITPVAANRNRRIIHGLQRTSVKGRCGSQGWLKHRPAIDLEESGGRAGRDELQPQPQSQQSSDSRQPRRLCPSARLAGRVRRPRHRLSQDGGRVPAGKEARCGGA